MPDLINPEQTAGEKKHIVWYDELCASCKVVDNCPLIQTIHRHTIMTYSGIHVSNCDLYDPDVDSEFYVPEGDRERAQNVKLAAMQQNIEELNAILERLDDTNPS